MANSRPAASGARPHLRIAVGRFWTESSSMSPLLANRAMFEAGALVEGPELLTFYTGTRTEVGGMLHALAAASVEPVPLLGAQAACAGPIEQQVWEWLHDRMLDRLRGAGPVDAVLLSLHGSSLAEREADTCGALLASVRQLVGPKIPIAATLDMHGNPTHCMATAADALVAYKTYPHHDFVERGRQAAKIAIAAARGEVRPLTVVTTIPMELPSLPLMNKLIADAVASERQPDVLCCSIMPTHGYLDVPEFHPLSAVVVTDDDRAAAHRIGAALMWDAWQQRHQAAAEAPRLVSVADGIREALAHPAGTVVLADRHDAVTAGFPGDCAEMVRVLLDQNIQDPACVIVTDPDVMAAAERAGIGATISTGLGGRWGGTRYAPVPAQARVRALTDGSLQRSREPRPGHLEISSTSMGKTAVLQINDTITALVTSVPVMSTEPTVYRSAGIEPYDYRLVFTKSVNQQRFHYPDAVGFLDLAGPGWGQTAATYQWQHRPTDRIFPRMDYPDADIRAHLDRGSTLLP